MPANTEKILSSVYAIRAMLETDKPARRPRRADPGG